MKIDSKTKYYLIFLLVIFISSFKEIRKDEKSMIGKWKFSGMFCTEQEEVPKGFFIELMENGKGYFEHTEVSEKEKFKWKTNEDTLYLDFENKNGIQNALFTSNEFIFKVLPWHKKHIQLRFKNFKECGLVIEELKK